MTRQTSGLYQRFLDVFGIDRITTPGINVNLWGLPQDYLPALKVEYMAETMNKRYPISPSKEPKDTSRYTKKPIFLHKNSIPLTSGLDSFINLESNTSFADEIPLGHTRCLEAGGDYRMLPTTRHDLHFWEPGTEAIKKIRAILRTWDSKNSGAPEPSGSSGASEPCGDSGGSSGSGGSGGNF